jgi:uncharacterized membrane protein
VVPVNSSQLRANRIALAATGVALAMLVPVAAHQLGFYDHLPDPPGKLFDSDAITDSAAAYPLGIPDSLLGLASYAATFALLLASRRHNGIHSVLRTKLALDASAAACNSVRQITKFRRICSWCTATAIATAVVVHYGRRSLDCTAK